MDIVMMEWMEMEDVPVHLVGKAIDAILVSNVNIVK